MKALRVLTVVPHYPPPVSGGLERQAHELARVLVQRGHQVTALSYAFHSSQRPMELHDGVQIRRIGSSGPRRFSMAMTPATITNALLQLRDDFDLAHVHVPSWFGAFALSVAQLLRKPTLFKMANVAELGIPGLQRTWSGRLRLSPIKRSDGIVAMNRESLDELASIEFPRHRILFRPNGIPLSQCPPQRQAHGVAKVVFVGRLSWEKRLQDLLVAWSTLASDIPASLHIVGEGPDREPLQRLANELAIERNVEFTGHSDAIEAILAESDIFVLPSEIEGNSNAVLEAMRAALPIVATQLSGTTLQVGPEGAPYLFDVGDTNRLATLLDQMIRSPPLRQATGSAMRRRVEARFSMEHVASDYEEAFYALRDGTPEHLHRIDWLQHASTVT